MYRDRSYRTLLWTIWHKDLTCSAKTSHKTKFGQQSMRYRSTNIHSARRQMLRGNVGEVQIISDSVECSEIPGKCWCSNISGYICACIYSIFICHVYVMWGFLASSSLTEICSLLTQERALQKQGNRNLNIFLTLKIRSQPAAVVNWHYITVFFAL